MWKNVGFKSSFGEGKDVNKFWLWKYISRGRLGRDVCFCCGNGGVRGEGFLFCKWIVSNKKAHPYLGKWSNLTNIFQIGWNHHLATGCILFDPIFSSAPCLWFWKKPVYIVTTAASAAMLLIFEEIWSRKKNSTAQKSHNRYRTWRRIWSRRYILRPGTSFFGEIYSSNFGQKNLEERRYLNFCGLRADRYFHAVKLARFQ